MKNFDYMRTHGPWKIKESIEKYKNKWIAVTEHQVIRPDGKDGIFGIVEMIAGVSVLPMDSDRTVYLTKEFRFAINRESIESVSGGIDKNEDVLTAAKRELQEELGITASEWVPLGSVDPFTSVVNCPSALFLARELVVGGSALPEGTEQIELIKMPFQEVLNMVMTGAITHGPTCVLILKANEYLKNEKSK
ncbi:MAG: NUDIX hydrolase [Candidatus Moraniibacteriota bacterium]|nr:MAG: NUDIX hydrolase [Candidatus Moranbacteria bacterium]